MVDWLALVVLLPFLLVALGILTVGYVAYLARRARERRAAVPADTGPDPTLELARLNREMEERLKESQATLEATRETLQKGIRG